MSFPKSAADVNRTGWPICCHLTGAERSAVAVIGVRGRGSAEAIRRCFTPAAPRRLQAGEVRYGRWHGDTSARGAAPLREGTVPIATESVVVTPLDDDSFEVHCHGGPAAVDRILSDLQRLGAGRVSPEQWLSDEATPLVQREAEQVLRRCVTARTAGWAMEQVRGELRRWAERHRAALQSALGDSSDSGESPESPQAALETLREDCRALLRKSEWGCRLSEPFRVVLCGPPNVGKSSLVNAIVGYERSITFDQAGTTRDVLHAETVIEGLPIQLTDTAGLRRSEEAIEREGVRRARRAALAADLVIWVSEPAAPVDAAELEAPAAAKHLRVLNKADLLPGGGQLPGDVTGDAIATIATTGRGIEELIRRIGAALIDAADDPTGPLVVTDRQAECVQQALTAPTTEAAAEALNRLVHGGNGARYRRAQCLFKNSIVASIACRWRGKNE